MNNHEKDIIIKNEQKIDEIKLEHKANFQEGLKATIGAAAVGGVLSFTTSVYKHYKNGKNIFKNELSKKEIERIRNWYS